MNNEQPQELGLQRNDPQKMAAAVGQAIPSPAEMLQAFISKGVTAENVSAVEQLVKLYERMEDRNAVKQFNEAFVKLQSELPVIVAMTVIPNRGRYARFEDVMHQIAKPMQDNGFSVSFSQDFKDNRTVETCTLRHVGGYSQQNSFAVRTGGRADSDTQADCKASTTAKRNALCNALNIVIRQDCLTEDEDAGIEGDPNQFVSSEQAFELERRAHEVNADIAALLQYAKAKQFGEIPASRYAELDAMLKRKEGRGR